MAMPNRLVVHHVPRVQITMFPSTFGFINPERYPMDCRLPDVVVIEQSTETAEPVGRTEMRFEYEIARSWPDYIGYTRIESTSDRLGCANARR